MICQFQSFSDLLNEGAEKRISLDLRNIDVVEALKFLAIKADVNIVTSRKVTGRVNLMIKDITIKDIFDIMLRSNGLAYDVNGTVYNVMSEDEYRALYGQAFSDVRKVKVFHLKYAIPEKIFSLCDSLKSEIGGVFVDTESGAVVVIDSPQKILTMGKAIAEFEKQSVIKVIRINYASAQDIAEQLKAQLNLKNVGSVRADERSNQIIVQTFPDRMKQIEGLVKKLDRKTKEVLIDAKIVKVKLTDNITESVEWEGLFDVGTQNGNGLTYLGSYPFSAIQGATDDWRSRNTVVTDVGDIGSYPFSGTSSTYNASTSKTALENMHIGLIDSQQDFDVTINYFKQIGETEIISTPKIVVTNNQEARIHVGEKQAYVTTTTTTGQTTSTVSEDVTFIDVGTQLFVTPAINDEGYITLKIKIEISDVVSVLETPSGNEIPIIDTSLAETTVMTKDNVSVVIGGLRREEKGKTLNKTPIIGDFPIIGKFFSSHSPNKSRTELLIMITPHLVSGEVLVGVRDNSPDETAIKSVKEYGNDSLEEALIPQSQTKGTKIKTLKNHD